MLEGQANELLDGMNFHYNKVRCHRIERMLPELIKMVVEMEGSLR